SLCSTTRRSKSCSGRRPATALSSANRRPIPINGWRLATTAQPPRRRLRADAREENQQELRDPVTSPPSPSPDPIARPRRSPPPPPPPPAGWPAAASPPGGGRTFFFRAAGAGGASPPGRMLTRASSPARDRLRSPAACEGIMEALIGIAFILVLWGIVLGG